MTLAATLFLSIVRCISYCMIDQSIPDAGMVGTKDVPTIQTGSGKYRHVDRKRSYVHSQGMTLIYLTTKDITMDMGNHPPKVIIAMLD